MDSPPVALCIFNRPDKTARTFEMIRQARPAILFVIADAPRTEKERDLCNATRAVTEHIDWPCDVRRKYAETNMGCECVRSGISWVFTQVDRAIILEDDCVPHPDFFPFCAELLERYKDEKRIMCIAGTNFQQGNKKFVCPESYYFATVLQQQGWATWRRAWNLYDSTLSAWPALEQSGALKEIFPDPAVREHWRYKYQGYYDNPLKTNWDSKWAFTCVFHRAYCITPKVNFISNIGYGSDATHTTTAAPGKANLPVYPLEFPLTHPTIIAPNENADAYEAKHYRGINLYAYQRILWFFKSHFPKIYQSTKHVLKPS